jgi:hypothetical protein
MKKTHTYTAVAIASALTITGCATTGTTTPRKPSQQEVADSLPRNRVWYPGDPMPSNVVGLKLAGDFAVQGTNTDSNPILIPAKDFSNPFARQFWMVNVTDTMGPNVRLNFGDRPLVRVSPRRPLVITSRGILPGIYNVAYR